MDGEAIDGGNSLFDPVRDALDNIKSGAKAGLKAVGKGDSKKANKNAGARDGLKSAEKSAENGGATKVDEGLSGVRKNESEAGGLYSGVGKSLGGSKGKGKGKGKGKVFLKKGGPMALILGLSLGVGGLMGGAQALMPFSLLAQFRETFDTIRVANERRSNVFFRKQLKNQGLKDPIHQRYFGFGEDKFKVGFMQSSKLRKQGIYVGDSSFAYDGRTQSIMLFDDGSGKLKVITPDVDSKVDASKVDLSKIKADIELDASKIDFDNPIDFKTAFNNIPDFRNGYIKASRTWRGSVGAWFDSITLRFLQSNKLTRNRFKDWQERVKSEQEGNTKSAAKKAATDLMESDSDSLEMDTKKYDYERDEDGNIIYEKDEHGNTRPKAKSDSVETKKVKFGLKIKDQAEIKTKLNEVKDGKMGKASGYISAAVNAVCTIFDVIGAINLLLVAQESIQIIQLVTSYFEAIDKVKAGDGDESPINTLAEGLVTPKATTSMDNSDEYKNKIRSTKIEDLGNDSGDDNIKEVIVAGKENTTAMQSEGISSLYSGQPINTNDASVQNFNIGSRLSTIMEYLGNSATSFASCAMAKAAAAIAGAVMDIVAIVSCAASFGIGCAVQAFLDAGGTLASSVAIAGGVQVAIGIITPLAVKIFTRDLISDLAGEDLGNALVSGANIYMGNNHLNGGGSLATKDKYVAFAIQQKEVIAEEARFQRETRDPFDVTSQYTFAGNLVKQMATMYTIKSPIFGGLGTAAKMVSSSIMALLPSASAYDISKTVKSADDEEFAANCPYLASIDAVGDAFCNPYIITDVSTIDDDPVDDVVENDYVKKGLTADGDIDKGSNLAMYIAYCSQRSSSFGVADGNIAGDFSSLDADWNFDNSTVNTAANTLTNSAIGAVPVIGDLVDVFNNSNQLANTGWITGQSCVASDDSMETKDKDGKIVSLGVSWDENKHYQRFVEDQRYLESANPDYESVVTKFLAEYYEENPLDNSYEGILARKSGLTKDQVIALLDILEEWNYIANYNPSERYAFGKPAVEMQEKLIFDSENQVAETPLIILINQTIYADVRNRNFVA